MNTNSYVSLAKSPIKPRRYQHPLKDKTIKDQISTIKSMKGHCNPLTTPKIINSKSININILYDPFGTKDTINQIIHDNASQILKNKKPYPVVCSNRIIIDKDLVDFIAKYPEDVLREYRSLVNKFGFHEACRKNNSVYFLAFYDAVLNMKVITPDDIKNDCIKNIRVLGHGKAGMPYLMPNENSNDYDCKHINTILDEMRPLIPKFKNGVTIKFTSCESADATPFHSFNHINTNIIQSKYKSLAKTARDSIYKYFGLEREIFIHGYHGNRVTGMTFLGCSLQVIRDKYIEDTLNSNSHTLSFWEDLIAKGKAKRSSLARREF